MRKPVIAVAALAAFFLALGAALWHFGPRSHSQPPETATLLDKPRPLPAVSLVDQDRRRFGAEQLRGQWSLLFFGFTNCGDVCPNTLTLMHAAHDRLLRDRTPPMQ